MERTKLTNRSIITIALAGFLILLTVWYVIGMVSQENSKYEYNLDSGWNVYVNDELVAADAKITDVNFGALEEGATIDLQYSLDERMDGGYSIALLVYLCSVEVFVDDQEIYSYGVDMLGKNQMIASGYHFIAFPDEVSGKTLLIHMIMNENNAYTSITTPKCAKTENILMGFARSQLINCLIGMFLVVLGGILFPVSIFATCFDRVYTRLIYIGAFSLLIGGWTIFGNKIAQIFSDDRMLYTNMEYISLYLAPIPFAYLMYTMRKDDKSIRKPILLAVCIVISVFGYGSIILHYANIVRFPQILTVFHGVGLSCIVVMAIAGYISVKDKSNSDSVTAMAMLILLGILGLDLGRFNIQKYLFPNNEILMNSIIPIGALVFVIMLIVSYLLYLYDMVMSKAEKETLTSLAYHDVLTGLYNRTKYEEDLRKYDDNGTDFALISLDVNGLKEINDNYGHNKGDLLLMTFSNIILKNFYDIGICYRTGGDEFMVIVESVNIPKITDALINITMDEKDASDRNDFVVEAAYGIAYRSEVESNAYDVFRLADHRMYEMKSQMKGVTYNFAD